MRLSLPIISIIVPTLNRANLLQRALKSIFDQTFTDFECIIIDGCSTDNTREVVSGFNDERIIFQLQKNPGNGAKATNEGLSVARGRYISFLDDDDEYLPNKLEKQYNYIETLPKKFGMVYCWMDYYCDNKLIHESHPTLRGAIFDQVLFSNKIGGTPTFFLRKEIIDMIGGFDENLTWSDDSDFVRRVAKVCEIDYIPEVLVNVHVGHGYNRQTDLTEKNLKIAIKESLYTYEKFKDDFDKDKIKKSLMYLSVAIKYARLKDLRNYLKNVWKSIMIAPFALGKYKALYMSIKFFFINSQERYANE